MGKQQKILIFEGPDGCGKTNIARELERVIGIPYFKNESEWSCFEDDPSYFINAMTYGDPYFLSYLEQTKASVIMDRWYPSEWVYSKAFKRPTDYGVLRSIDDRAAALDAKIIIPCRTSYDGVVDQFESIKPAILQDIEEIYRAFSDWTNCDTFFLNVDDENLDRELFEVLNFVGGYERG